MKIRGAWKYALSGDTLRGAYAEVRAMNQHDDHWEPIVYRNFAWKLRVTFPRITAAIDLAGFLVERMFCFSFGHKWDVASTDAENGMDVMVCRRCGFDCRTYW